jgi:ribosomal protein L24E
MKLDKCESCGSEVPEQALMLFVPFHKEAYRFCNYYCLEVFVLRPTKKVQP